MAENSKIEWTHHTFNPWMGCTKVSAACDHCYAEAQTARFKQVEWGQHADRKRTSAGNWKNPLRWNRQAEAKGIRYRVFCASLADVFDNHKTILPEWRDDLWQLIRDTPHLDWLLLTKRPQNIAKYLPDDLHNNLWLGTTVENQEEADRRIPHLLGTKAAVHFLSCEPLLGPLNLWSLRLPKSDLRTFQAFDGLDSKGVAQFEYGVDWVICGGESAPDDVRRDMKEEWAIDLQQQCEDAGAPFLFKQWSGKHQPDIKSKGRELNGVVHNGYPVPAS